MVEEQPMFLTDLCYTAGEFRRELGGQICAEGVSSRTSLAVTTGGSGLNLFVSAGSAFIQGDDDPDQGMYSVRNDAQVTVTATAADPTNPRIDQVVATVRDSDYGGTDNDWFLQVVPGTPTVGATLVNLTGAAALPDDSIRLAYVLVPATFAGPFVNATHIQDARNQFGSCGGEGVLVQKFTATGVGSWAKPAGAKKVKITCVGSGGGGGNAISAAAASSVGGGGGAGGIAITWADAEDLADNCYLSLSIGGFPNTGGLPSSFKAGPLVGDTTICSATGGDAGQSSTASTVINSVSGGVGGVGTVGDLLIPGGAGDVGFRITGTFAVSGAGGDSQFGAGGRAVDDSAVGNDGRNYGGGGSGGTANTATARDGGSGAQGLIIVETYF